MELIAGWLPSFEMTPNFVNTLVVVLVFLLVRVLSVQLVKGWQINNLEIKRKWLVHVKNLSLVVLFLGLLIVWASELRTFALSLVAIAAAVAISLKEIIMCIMGGILKTSTRVFDIGDRIEVQGLRGDVLDHDFLTTRLLEIGPGTQLHQFTGRTIVLPNSIFLTHPVINETHEGDFVLHVFKIPRAVDEKWSEAESHLLESAVHVCQPFLDAAKRSLKRTAEKRGIEVPNCDPRVWISIPDPARMDFFVRVPTPALRKGRVEQEIIKRFLASITKAGHIGEAKESAVKT